MYTITQYDCVTGETTEVVLDRREYLIFLYGLDANTTIEDAEAVAATDANPPEPASSEPQ